MRQTPDAANLIAIARKTLLETLLPDLPAGKRYAGLMVANALAIAGRQLQSTAVDDLALFRQVLPDLPEAVDAPAAEEALVKAIRAGQFDDAPAALFSVLEPLALERARVSAPKALKKD